MGEVPFLATMVKDALKTLGRALPADPVRAIRPMLRTDGPKRARQVPRAASHSGPPMCKMDFL